MADVDHNLAIWSSNWDWSQRGDEWSWWWGDTPALWTAVLLPRIHAFVPTGSILEIAPGYGRWTQFLKDLCEHLTIVDLTEGCIEHCRERFADATNIEYHVNDGRSLEMVEDGSIDFAFSFDSLVHVEEDVLGAYVDQLARKVPSRFFEPLVRRGVLINLPAWRAESVTAELFADRCEQAGLSCITQEKVSWEFGRYVIDTFSFFTPRGSRWDRPRRVLRNPLFVREAARARELYARESFTR